MPQIALKAARLDQSKFFLPTKMEVAKRRYKFGVESVKSKSAPTHEIEQQPNLINKSKSALTHEVEK
jgi:hypothetical protein